MLQWIGGSIHLEGESYLAPTAQILPEGEGEPDRLRAEEEGLHDEVRKDEVGSWPVTTSTRCMASLSTLMDTDARGQ